jgi:periplasmic mercuric ion binding protein
MKKIKHVLMAFILVITATTGIFAQAKQEEEIKIKTSAVCKMCKATIEKNLAYEKGVKEATLDVPSQIVTVTYNPKKTDAARIKKAINESGYDADQLPADSRAYDRLEDCCKKDKGIHEN